MAEPLKNFFGPEIPKRIGNMVGAVWPGFRSRAFVNASLIDYEALSLTQRAGQIARVLRNHLPAAYPQAIEILLASLAEKRAWADRERGMGSFLYLPHVIFVAEYGLEHFEESMRAQHELTQRFTAEFSIRAFIERHPERTLECLRLWARDPSVDVRRLVSEGTRPRLPWARRLREFQKDPRPVLALLELLKDDPELYVRRSVANNLNDISKDHPTLVIDTVRRWQVDATPQRQWIIKHALRSAIKRAERDALAVLGFDGNASVSVRKRSVEPRRVRVGKSVQIAFDLANAGSRAQQVLADLRVHFVKANGAARAKVFKLKALQLEPRAAVSLRKKLSLADLTTRKHYPGVHRVEVVVNGRARAIGKFELTR
jgi:3-methyladenine DNA glycosylase AlkC